MLLLDGGHYWATRPLPGQPRPRPADGDAGQAGAEVAALAAQAAWLRDSLAPPPGGAGGEARDPAGAAATAAAFSRVLAQQPPDFSVQPGIAFAYQKLERLQPVRGVAAPSPAAGRRRPRRPPRAAPGTSPGRRHPALPRAAGGSPLGRPPWPGGTTRRSSSWRGTWTACWRSGRKRCGCCWRRPRPGSHAGRGRCRPGSRCWAGWKAPAFRPAARIPQGRGQTGRWAPALAREQLAWLIELTGQQGDHVAGRAAATYLGVSRATVWTWRRTLAPGPDAPVSDENPVVRDAVRQWQEQVKRQGARREVPPGESLLGMLQTALGRMLSTRPGEQGEVLHGGRLMPGAPELLGKQDQWLEGQGFGVRAERARLVGVGGEAVRRWFLEGGRGRRPGRCRGGRAGRGRRPAGRARGAPPPPPGGSPGPGPRERPGEGAVPRARPAPAEPAPPPGGRRSGGGPSLWSTEEPWHFNQAQRGVRGRVEGGSDAPLGEDEEGLRMTSWQVSLDHELVYLPENERRFPWRDPGDPLRRVYRPYAAPDGRLHPDVRVLGARLGETPGMRALLGRDWAGWDRVRARLQADVLAIARDMLAGERGSPPAPGAPPWPRIEARRLAPADLPPHEQALQGQHGTFLAPWALAAQGPARPLLSTGQVLGLYAGAITDTGQEQQAWQAAHPSYPSHTIAYHQPSGRTGQIASEGYATAAAFANTRLAPGPGQPRIDRTADGINAVSLQFSIELSLPGGGTRPEPITAIAALDRLYHDRNPAGMVLLDYGDSYLPLLRPDPPEEDVKPDITPGPPRRPGLRPRPAQPRAQPAAPTRDGEAPARPGAPPAGRTPQDQQLLLRDVRAAIEGYGSPARPSDQDIISLHRELASGPGSRWSTPQMASEIAGRLANGGHPLGLRGGGTSFRIETGYRLELPPYLQGPHGLPGRRLTLHDDGDLEVVAGYAADPGSGAMVPVAEIATRPARALDEDEQGRAAGVAGTTAGRDVLA